MRRGRGKPSPTPEQLASLDRQWLAENIEQYLEENRHPLLDEPGGLGRYVPEVEGKAIPEEGAWILVLDVPPTDLDERFEVPLLSMWRARPHTASSCPVSVDVVTQEFRTQLRLLPRQAVIATPGGDLHLWPHEYAMATDPRALVSDHEATIHTLGGEPLVDPEQMFYLMSRGVPYSQAVLMLFDQVRGTDHCYVTFPEEITSLLAGIGRPIFV